MASFEAGSGLKDKGVSATASATKAGGRRCGGIGKAAVKGGRNGLDAVVSGGGRDGDRLAPSAGAGFPAHPRRLRPVPGAEAAAPSELGALSRPAGKPGQRPSSPMPISTIPAICRLWCATVSGRASIAPTRRRISAASCCRIAAICRSRTRNSPIVMASPSTSRPCRSTASPMPSARCTHFSGLPFDQEKDVAGGARVRLRHAGHILGAAIVEVAWGGKRVVFSGDLGRYDDPILPDPAVIEAADYLVVESTYGDRAHKPVDPQALLGEVIERTAARGGTVVIPAFRRRPGPGAPVPSPAAEGERAAEGPAGLPRQPHGHRRLGAALPSSGRP